MQSGADATPRNVTGTADDGPPMEIKLYVACIGLELVNLVSLFHFLILVVIDAVNNYPGNRKQTDDCP